MFKFEKHVCFYTLIQSKISFVFKLNSTLCVELDRLWLKKLIANNKFYTEHLLRPVNNNRSAFYDWKYLSVSEYTNLAEFIKLRIIVSQRFSRVTRFPYCNAFQNSLLNRTFDSFGFVSKSCTAHTAVSTCCNRRIHCATGDFTVTIITLTEFGGTRNSYALPRKHRGKSNPVSSVVVVDSTWYFPRDPFFNSDQTNTPADHGFNRITILYTYQFITDVNRMRARNIVLLSCLRGKTRNTGCAYERTRSSKYLHCVKRSGERTYVIESPVYTAEHRFTID